jgi:DNA replication protein DnaC
MNPIDLTQNHLAELRLHGMRLSFANRLREAQNEGLGMEQFLASLLDDEVQYRKNARVARLVKCAGFRSQASCENIDFTAKRNLEKKLVQDLSTSRFIRDGLNVLIAGPCGVGKTHLATAIGNSACRNGYTTIFFRMNTLLEKLVLVRAQGAYLNFIKRVTSADLVVLDDFGIKPLSAQQLQDLYDILDERSEGKATVITTQLPIANWPEVIPDLVTCEAITDRFVSRAIQVMMKGESYRKKILKGLDVN